MQDEFIEIKIYKTTNYDQFVLLPENRPVKGNVVGNSILKKNLLLDNPILVTPFMEVLDGQHRLAFARKNQIPIYYKISQVTTREHIALLQNANPWRLVNHQKFHKNNPDYAFVEEMVEKYKFSMYFVIGCCDPSNGSSERFKNGDFVVKGEKDLLTAKFAEMHELIQICKFLLKTCDQNKLFINNKFNRALWTFIHREDYDHKRLTHAFEAHPDDTISILKVYSESLVLDALKILFNKALKKKNRIS
jgi:hypothetical protein